MSLFGALGTATSGLNANQISLETASHNIANSTTPGYSRQRTNLQTSFPYEIAGTGLIGTGVNVAGIERITDDFLIGQVRQANSEFQTQSQKSDVLSRLEGILNEPSDSGLLNALKTLNESWTKLANNPELDTAKTAVVESTKSFLDILKNTSNQAVDLQADTIESIGKSVLDFNEKAKQLNDVNNQIFALKQQGDTPNDLLDSRDRLLKDLSAITSIETSLDGYGRASIKIDGQVILDKDKLRPLQVTNSASQGVLGEISFTDDSGLKQVLTLKSGAIKGQQDGYAIVGDQMSALDKFTETIARATNLIYTGGKSETTGFYTVDESKQPVSQSIEIDEAIFNNPSELKVGLTEQSPAGDSSKAAAMARIANVKFGEPDTIGSHFNSSTLSFDNVEQGVTITGVYNTIVTRTAISKQQADNMTINQQSILTQLENKEQSISGVSMNEEMSDVIRYQQGFQANARILSVVSEMLDTLINRTGV